MAEIRLVIGNKDGKSYSKIITDESLLQGRKIGEILKGDLIGLTGYELKISGGSDESGSPMRKEINVAGKKKIYAKSGIGVRSLNKGDYIRKTVAGNVITEKTSQINLIIMKEGKKPLTEIFGKKEPQENK